MLLINYKIIVPLRLHIDCKRQCKAHYLESTSLTSNSEFY